MHSDRMDVTPPEPRDDAPPEAAASPAAGRQPDFSRAVLEDLYRYPRKRDDLAFVLWGATGLLGGHRFYLERPLTGLLMLLTGGGAILWWLVDVFLLPGMVRDFNADQAERERTGQPPKALAFMPAQGAVLPPAPAWAAARKGRRQRTGDLLVLFTAGFSAGALAGTTGIYEPIVTIVALCAITLLGARWDALAGIPVLRSFDRWSHRLRLFYYLNDPGGPLRLLFRPLAGLLTAPFRPRARAEAWLYLQLGAWFTVIFTGMDLIDSVSIEAGGLALHPMDFLADVALTFASIYGFAAPIGGILTAHLLLEKGDLAVWLLAAVAMAATLLGFIA